MLELIEDKNNQLVEALLAINEVSSFILSHSQLQDTLDVGLATQALVNMVRFDI